MRRKAWDEITVNEEQIKEQSQETAAAVADEPQAEAIIAVEASNTAEELEKVKVERDALVDRVARLQAEFDNARKREARERNDFRDFALANTVEQFLPVLD